MSGASASEPRRGVKAVCAGLLAVLLAAGAAGHEVRPAYLQISAVAGDTAGVEYDILWKLPLIAGRPLPLTPVFPDGCTVASAGVDAVAGGALVRRSRLRCPTGLRGGTVAIDGLEATITDAMLHVSLADGARLTHLLKPTAPAAVIGAAGAASTLAYLVLGVEHLLLGFDHILFVLSLLFFVSRPAALVRTVTSFTVAHSITLGLAALDLARLPQAPVEAVIALSIVFLAVEKLRGAEATLTARHTWLVAFAFGLLHGFGFAGALADIGLPRDNALLALFLFNVGVEIGQLAVVAAALALLWGVRKSGWRAPRRLVLAPLYATGGIAAYWFVARLAAIVA